VPKDVVGMKNTRGLAEARLTGRGRSVRRSRSIPEYDRPVQKKVYRKRDVLYEGYKRFWGEIERAPAPNEEREFFNGRGGRQAKKKESRCRDDAETLSQMGGISAGYKSPLIHKGSRRVPTEGSRRSSGTKQSGK